MLSDDLNLKISRGSMPQKSLATLYLETDAILSNFHHWMSYQISGYVLQALFLWRQHCLRISSKVFLKDS